MPDNEAGWRGAVRDVDSSGVDTTRHCFNSFATPDGSDIKYGCSHAAEFPKVLIDLTGIPRTQTRSRGDASLCDFFDGGVEFTPLTNDSYAQQEPCPAGAVACEVRVLNWSFESAAAVARGVGLIIFEGFGDATGASDNPNPFSEPQSIDIFEINATFKAKVVGSRQLLTPSMRWLDPAARPAGQGRNPPAAPPRPAGPPPPGR